MSRIQLIIQKDDGSEIQKIEHHFKSNKNFDDIEKEVDSFKNKILPEIEGELLKEAQQLFIQEEKKRPKL